MSMKLKPWAFKFVNCHWNLLYDFCHLTKIYAYNTVQGRRNDFESVWARPFFWKSWWGRGGLRHIFFLGIPIFFSTFIFNTGRGSKKEKRTQKVCGPGPHSRKSGWAIGPHGSAAKPVFDFYDCPEINTYKLNTYKQTNKFLLCF